MLIEILLCLRTGCLDVCACAYMSVGSNCAFVTQFKLLVPFLYRQSLLQPCLSIHRQVCSALQTLKWGPSMHYNSALRVCHPAAPKCCFFTFVIKLSSSFLFTYWDNKVRIRHQDGTLMIEKQMGAPPMKHYIRNNQ